MKLFGFEISRIKAQSQSYSAVPAGGGGWFNIIRESFGGAFQQGVTVDSPRQVLAFSAVFACVSIIAGDVAKLRIRLVHEDDDGIDTEIKTGSPFLAVLKRPNGFQTRQEFIEQWIVSKLLYGNAYALKQRDRRGIVTALYILDAQRVTPLVADDGGIYYQLAKDYLSQLTEPITVPAREIIHDRMACLFHPLVGVSPIFACGMSATMGNRIQSNSTKFFENMSRPSGQLTAPGKISDEVAARLKATFEERFSGGNIGRLFVAGDGLKYEQMTVSAHDAELLAQLKFTIEDVARCFNVPLFKLGGPIPIGNTVEALQQTYYNDCLQTLIESLEAHLDEGLALPTDYYSEVDLDGLLRMDNSAMIKAEAEAVGAAIKAPNESRRRLNLKPKTGGDSLMMQQQNFSLEALAKRDALPDPFATGKPAPSAKRESAVTITAGDVSLTGFEELSGRMDELADAIERVDQTLALPVRPIYDQAGKLVAAQRDPGGGKIERARIPDDFAARLKALEEHAPLGYLESRIAALEQRTPLSYGGAWADGQTSDQGVFYSFQGSLWFCRETSKDRPGTSSAFQLAVKKGRDAPR